MEKGQSVKYKKLEEEKEKWKDFVEKNSDKKSSKWSFSTNTWSIPEKKGYKKF